MVISYYISKKLTDLFFDLHIIEESNMESYQFCFEYTFDIIIYNTSLVVIGLLLHDTLAATIYMLIMLLLKTTAGGAHAKSRLHCSILSYGLFFITILSSNYIHFFSCYSNTYSPIMMIYLGIISAIIVILAPVNHPNKHFYGKRRMTLKKLCLLFLIVIISLYLLLYHFKQERLCTIILMCLSAIFINQLIGLANNRRIQDEF